GPSVPRADPTSVAPPPPDRLVGPPRPPSAVGPPLLSPEPSRNASPHATRRDAHQGNGSSAARRRRIPFAEDGPRRETMRRTRSARRETHRGPAPRGRSALDIPPVL